MRVAMSLAARQEGSESRETEREKDGQKKRDEGRKEERSTLDYFAAIHM